MVRKVFPGPPVDIITDDPNVLAREINIFTKDAIVVLHSWMDEMVNINFKKSRDILQKKTKVNPNAISRIRTFKRSGEFIAEIIEAAPATFFDVGVKPHIVPLGARSVTGGTMFDWVKEHNLFDAIRTINGVTGIPVASPGSANSKLKQPGLRTLIKGFKEAMRKELAIFKRQRARLRRRSNLIFSPKQLT